MTACGGGWESHIRFLGHHVVWNWLMSQQRHAITHVAHAHMCNNIAKQKGDEMRRIDKTHSLSAVYTSSVSQAIDQ